MLANLYRLYRRHTTKTPLEDFTTEAFSGILRFDHGIFCEFLSKFLLLPKGEYNVKTQKEYFLIDEQSCIIDMVLESEDTICFIENKVNSKEGFRQLERYSKVLETIKNTGKQTYLFYCTKYFDEKKLIDHRFVQFRWFQVANFLKSFDDNALVRDFLNFLKIHDMSQELAINTTTLLAMEKLSDLLETTKGYLDRVKPIFIQKFKSGGRLSDGFSTSQLIDHKRLIYYVKDILGSGGWSEIKYGFQTSSTNIYVGIWVDKSNSEFKLFKKFFDGNDRGFIVKNLSNGITIELSSSLTSYLNKENSDSEISNWYIQSFEKFDELICNMEYINWKIN